METFVRLSAYTGRNLPVVQAVQGDTNRVITVEIKEFESLEGTTCRLVAMRPLGTDAKIDGTIDGGRVSFDLTDAITMSGDIYAQVQVTEGNNRVSTFDFVLQVSESREAMATAKEIYWVEDFIGKEGQKVDDLIQTKGAAFDEMQNQKETAFDQFASAASDRFEEFMEGADQSVDNLIETTTDGVSTFLELAEERVSEAVQAIPDLVDNKFAEKLAEIDEKVSEASGYASAAETAKESAESAKTAAESASEASQASANAAEVSASEAANSASQAATVVESAIVPLQQRIAKVESVNHRQQIEIDLNTAFRKDKYSIEVEDSSVAYTKDVPVGALPWAEVKSIGGMSRRGLNLLNPNPSATRTEVLDNGRTIVIDNTSGSSMTYSSVFIEQDFPQGNYYLMVDSISEGDDYSDIYLSIGSDSDYSHLVQNNLVTSGKYSFSTNSTGYLRFMPVVRAGEKMTINGLRIVRSDSDEWEPYTAELLSANLSEIESRGAEGVIGSKPFPTELASKMHGINSDVYDEVELVPRVYENMKPVDMGTLNWARHSQGFFFAYLADAVIPSSNNESANILTGEFFTVPSNPFTGDRVIALVTDGNLKVRDSRYSTAQEFKQAMSGVILHYEAVSGGEDYEAVLLKKKCGVIDLGMLNWSKDGDNRFYHRKGNEIVIPKPLELPNAICDKYEPVTYINVSTRTKEGLAIANSSTQSTIFVYDTNFNDTEAFKTAMSGVELIYELATPQILDVTEYFTDENYRFLEVEGGGTITFKQDGDYKLAIPSVVEYDVKVGE